MRGSMLRSILAAAAIAILLLMPLPSHRTPAWDIWVVPESSHHPVEGVEVTERYGFDNPQTLTSDAQGHVRFESRVPWISLAHRLLARRSAKVGPTFPGATGFVTINAAGHGMTGNVKMSWTGPSPSTRGTRITMHPAYKSTGAAGQHTTGN
jgi:hypothetical protein